MIAKLTVPALKALATDMNIVVPSKALKADIVALINAQIDTLHAEALEIERTVEANNKAFDALEAVMVANDASETVTAEDRMRNRVQSYMQQNGTDKLTRRQLRRINKKYRANGVNPWALSYDYSTVFSH